MDFNSLIERKRERFEQLEREIADPALFENRKRASDIMREHSSVKQLLARWTELETARQQLDDNRELAASSDVEIAAMADDEIPDLQKRVTDLERDFQIALLPPDENENRDAIIEIRAGTGGSEAAIFAADLYRMYNRYAEAAGLEDRGSGVESVGAGRIEGSPFSRFRAKTFFASFVTRAASIACNASRPRKRRAAFTPPPRPWRSCPRRRKSISN